MKNILKRISLVLFAFVLCVSFLNSNVVITQAATRRVNHRQACKQNDHTYGNWVVKTFPSCYKSGESYRKCKYCGYIQTRKVDAYNRHSSLKYVKTVKPTCTSNGYTEYVCSRCYQHFHKNITKALGHIWVKGKIENGKQKYYCTRCDKTKYSLVTGGKQTYPVKGGINKTKTKKK